MKIIFETFDREPARMRVLEILSECLTVAVTSGRNVLVGNRLGNETQGVWAAMKVA